MIYNSGAFTNVFLAVMPNTAINVDTIFPFERKNEIDLVNNPTVKAQKFWVWKLLECAISNSTGKDIKEFKFFKSENGKWTCKNLYFSLTHSDNLLGVAVSNAPVGIDVEKLAIKNRRAIEKVLTHKQKQEYLATKDVGRDEFLISAWSKKESAFKMSDEEKFLPSKINGEEHCLLNQRIECAGESYILTLCSKTNKKIEIFKWVDLIGND